MFLKLRELYACLPFESEHMLLSSYPKLALSDFFCSNFDSRRRQRYSYCLAVVHRLGAFSCTRLSLCYVVFGFH